MTGMDEFQAKLNPAEDMQHAQAMLARMSPEDLLRATYALEDILDGGVYVTHDSPIEDEVTDQNEEAAAAQGRKELAAGRTASLEDVLDACGLTPGDLEQARPAKAA